MTFLVVRWAVIEAYVDGNAAPRHGAVFFKLIAIQRYKVTRCIIQVQGQKILCIYVHYFPHILLLCGSR